MESIVFFIIVAIISSLFKNKEKWIKEQPDQPNQTIQSAKVPKFEQEQTYKQMQVVTQKPIQEKNTLIKEINYEAIGSKQQPITKNQLVQGVIWSEILGPPRSKRPHSLKK